MNKSQNSAIRLGMFITISILLFIIAVYLVGSRKSMFQSNIKIISLFSDVQGLRDGAHVRFSGINVGTVTKLLILNDSTVQVEMAIDQKVTPFIKKNSLATIATEGLMGNKIVVLLPGSPDEASISQRDSLPSLEPIEIDDILQEIMTSGERISIVSANLIDITDKINRGEGIFGKLFTDTSIAYNLNRSSANLKEISDRVNRGEGLMGRLFADTIFARNVDSAALYMESISQNLNGVTDKIYKGEGIFGRLLTDTTLTRNIYSTSQNLNRSTRNMEVLTNELLEITGKINRGKGTINKLLVDSVFADSLDITLRKLNTTITEVQAASEALQRSGMIRAFSKKETEQK
jgi:phospholipid/cholesterol/gamma-HCH transport system substrate-binding protein